MKALECCREWASFPGWKCSDPRLAGTWGAIYVPTCFAHPCPTGGPLSSRTQTFIHAIAKLPVPRSPDIKVILLLPLEIDPFVESIGFIFMTDLSAHYTLSHFLNPWFHFFSILGMADLIICNVKSAFYYFQIRFLFQLLSFSLCSMLFLPRPALAQ